MSYKFSFIKKVLPAFLAAAIFVNPQTTLAAYEPDNSTKPDPLSLQKQMTGVDVGEFTGAALYEYPIELPAGRNGMTPSLSLTFNSQDESFDNMLGYHWGMTDHSIKRFNKRGVDQLYSREDFVASTPFASGELTSLGGNVFAEKYENSFARYERRPDGSWLVTDKRGTQYIFGQSQSSRQFDPSDASRVFEWKLEEVRDTNDNFIRYTYERVGQKLYPSEIHYTGHGSQDGIFRVRFLRSQSEREDSHFSYATGFRVDTDHLIEGVEVYVDGQLRKKYEFDHTQVQQFTRNTIGSIRETGYNAAGSATSLPPTEFDYSESSVSWEQTDDYEPAWAFLSSAYNGGSQLPTVYMWDMNGDALIDFEYWAGYYQGNNFITSRRHINDGQGGWIIEDGQLITSIGAPQVPDSWNKAIDFNGDARVDRLRNIPTSNPYYELDLSTGGRVEDSIDVNIAGSHYSKGDNGANLTDINGDGLTDIIQGRNFFYDFNPVPERKTCLNQNGDSCVETNLWESPISYVQDDLYGQYPRRNYVQDCNYDGLADLHAYNGATWRYINDGKGGFVVNPEGSCYFTNLDSRTVRSADVNGDGLMDQIRAYVEVHYVGQTEYRHVDLNIGNGSVTGTQEISNVFPMVLGSLGSSSSGDAGVRIFDLNGDKLPDIMRAAKSTDQDSIVTFSKEVYLNTSTRPYFLETIRTSSGAEIDFEYQTSAQYRRPNGTQANPNLPIVVDTVKRMSVDDGQGNISTTDYLYEDGHFHYEHAYDKGFAGFGVVTKTDQDGYKTKSYYHQGQHSINNASRGEHDDHISKKGRVYRTETYNTSGTVASQTINKYEHRSLGQDHFFPHLSRTLTQTFDGGLTKSVAQTFTYDDIGNRIQTMDYGEVNATGNDGSFTDAGTDLLQTFVDYISQTNFPYQTRVLNHAGGQLSHMKYYYDYLGNGQVSEGNQTAQEQWLDTNGTWLRGETNYSQFGLPISQKNPRGFVSYTEYDAHNLYPRQHTNAKGHVTDLSYDPATGQVLSSTDPNGVISTMQYDGLGRLVRSEKDGQLMSTVVYSDNTQPRSVFSRAFNDDGQAVDQYTFLDGLDRQIESKKEASDNKWITTQVIYDARSNVSKQVQPYFSNSNNFESLNPSKVGNSFTYDALGRVITITNPLGSTTNSYRGFEVTTIDAEGNRKVLAHDARQKLIRVDEHNEGAVYQTHYTYDPLGRLLSIRDAENNLRDFEYDSLGRRTSQSKLASTDRWRYEYDQNGNMIQKTDPMGQVTQYGHDEVDRVLFEDFLGNTVTEIVYEYDQGLNAVGRVNHVGARAYIKDIEYDAWGRISAERIKINDKSFDFAYDYDQMGAVRSITLPKTANQIRYEYNAAHQLEEVKYGSDVYANDFSYTPLGQVASMRLGNGVITTNNYDPSKLYQLTGKEALSSSETLQDYHYTYDNIGNIRTLVDGNSGITAKTVAYDYDNLSRLKSASYSGMPNVADFTQAYQYSPIGNIIHKSDVGDYSYGGSHPHAVTSAGSHLFDYDENGNMSMRDGAQMIHDYRNRLVESAGQAYYAYSDGYDRVFKWDIADSQSTYYPSKYYEEHHDKVVRYIYAGDQRIAKVEEVTSVVDPAPDPDPDPIPDPTPDPDPNPNPDPDPSPTPDPVIQPKPVVPTPGAPSRSGGGGGYRSQDQLKLMKMINDGQEDKAQELSRRIYHHQLVAQAKEERKELQTGSLPDTAFENLHIKYNRNTAMIQWDAMPHTVKKFQIYRSKGNYAGPLDEPDVLIAELKADKSKNRFYDNHDDPFAKYSYKIVALNKRDHPVLTSFNLHARQIFLKEGTRKIVDFRNFSDTDFSHVKITSNEFIDGTESRIPQRLYIVEDQAIQNGARIDVRFLECDEKKDGSKYCKRLDQKLVDVYVLDDTRPAKRLVSFLGRQFAGLVPSAVANTSENTYYFLNDHLDSVDVVLDDQANVVERRDYLPFGAERLVDDTGITETDPGYTGKELDEETGLNYYGARYYDSAIGRFTSVDPLVMDEGYASGITLASVLNRPQALNAYSYTENKPINHIDPTGEGAEKISGIFTGTGRVLDGIASGVGSYYAIGASKALPGKMRAPATGYGLALGANSLYKLDSGLKTIASGKESDGSKFTSIARNTLLNSPISVSKGNFVTKAALKQVTDIHMFEDTLEMIGRHVEEQARWVVPVDVSHYKPLKDTELVQGPRTVYGRIQKTINTAKGRVKEVLKPKNNEKSD